MRETSAQTIAFYRDLVQDLKAWQAPAPRLRNDPDTETVPPTTDSLVVPAGVEVEPPQPQWTAALPPSGEP